MCMVPANVGIEPSWAVSTFEKKTVPKYSKMELPVCALLMWSLLIVAIGAAELHHDSSCKTVFVEDALQVTCSFSKNVYQEKVDFIIEMFAANSDDPSTVAGCTWEEHNSLKPDCHLFPGVHLNGNITNVVAITVPTNRLPAGGGRFMCQMVKQARKDFLPCSWPDPEPQTTAPPGNLTASASSGEHFKRTDSHYSNLAVGAFIFGTFIVATLLNWSIYFVLLHKGYLSWNGRTRREKANTAEAEENGRPLSAVVEEEA